MLSVIAKRDVAPIALRLVALAALLALWWFLSRDGSGISRLALPAPADVITIISTRWVEIVQNAAETSVRVGGGLLIGGALGIVVGLGLYSSSLFRAFAETYIELIRPIPPVALSPFFIFWFGLGELGQFLLIGLTAFLVLVVSVFSNAMAINRLYIRVATVFGMPKAMILRCVILPAILPPLGGATRVAAAGCWSVSIAAEYLGAQGGLGYMIRNARVTLQTDVILVAAIVLGILSYSLDAAIRLTFRWMTSWSPTQAAHG